MSEEEFEKVRAKYPKFNEPWEDQDVEDLKQMFADTLPISDISEQIGRTPNSVRMKLKSLGLLQSHPAPKSWSEEDDAALIEGYEEGTPFEELATRFERSVNAIVARLIHLRLSLFQGYPMISSSSR